MIVEEDLFSENIYLFIDIWLVLAISLHLLNVEIDMKILCIDVVSLLYQYLIAAVCFQKWIANKF